jgi:2-oxoglutarate ferredoxin oxidoreductase subunit alpha
VLRPVLAPTSVADTFGVTVEAFNIAEQYQTPVIVLSDQEIAQRKETVDPIDTSRFTVEERAPRRRELVDYARFAHRDGISPISHPG